MIKQKKKTIPLKKTEHSKENPSKPMERKGLEKEPVDGSENVEPDNDFHHDQSFTRKKHVRVKN